MKKLTLKSIITTALFALMLFAFAVGGITLTRADVEVQKTTGFTMEGAQARILEPYGLRFKAKLGQIEYESLKFEDGDYLGMLIVPQVYLDYYAEDLGEQPDYVTVLESKGDFLANVQNITPYAEGNYWFFNGVLGNIKYENLNVDFVGIGYYYLNGEYHYAQPITRNFGEIISTTVAMGTFDDSDVVGKANDLYALSLAQKLGKTEDQAKEFVEKELAGKLTGKQVANFDDESYLEILTNEENFTRWTSKFADGELNIVDIDDRKALELRATNYRALTINFAKPAIVKENTVINLTIKTPSSSQIWVNADSIIGPAVANTWSTAAYLATDLGYEVGDVMSKISLSLHHATEWYYIDEITVTDKVDLSTLLTDVSSLNYGEVANFNHADYALFDFGVGTGASVTDSGKIAVKVPWSNGFADKVHIPFAREITVREGDKLVFTLGGTGLRIDKKDGMNYENNNYYGQVMTIPLADLGYSVGDKVSYLTLSGNNYVATIDYIKVVNDKEEQIKLVEGLSGYQIANFDDAGYQNLVSSGTVSNGNLVTNKKETITVTLPQAKTFTGNDYLVFNVKETGWMKVNGRYVTGPSNLADGDFNWYNNADNCNGFFIRATEGYHLVILPVVVAKCNVGESISSLTISNNYDDAELALDWIECVTLSSSSLTLKEALKEYYELKLALTPIQLYPNATSASVNFADKNAMALIQANPYVGKQNYTVTYVEDEQAVLINSSETGYIASNVRLYFAKSITLTANTKVQLTVKVDMDSSRGYDFELRALGGKYQYCSLVGAKNGITNGTYVTVTLETNGTNNLFRENMHGQELSYLDLWFGEEFNSISIKSITVIE